jgi:DNA repair exonuclease SbcCD ATPase subunit
MADEKDRLGEKLRQKEKAEEDRFFAEREKALLEKMRHEKTADAEQDLRALTRDRCPKCGTRLDAVLHHGVTVDECPSCHGVWLDKGELERVAAREHDSWLGRLFSRPR